MILFVSWNPILDKELLTKSMLPQKFLSLVWTKKKFKQALILIKFQQSNRKIIVVELTECLSSKIFVRKQYFLKQKNVVQVWLGSFLNDISLFHSRSSVFSFEKTALWVFLKLILFCMINWIVNFDFVLIEPIRILFLKATKIRQYKY